MIHEQQMTTEIDQPVGQLENGLAVLPRHESGGRWRSLVGKVLAIAALAASVSVAIESSAAEKAHDKFLSSPKQELTLNAANPWAGYDVSTPSNLDYVTDDFIVPSISCPPSGVSEVSMWAGVGAGTDADPLYQTGVKLKCDTGTESSYVWWEDYTPDGGSGALEQDYSGRTVSAGDKIVAQVIPNSGPGHNVELYVQDYGSNLSQAYPNWTAHTEINLSSAPSPSIVECIAERPSDNNGSPYDLLDFGSITFSTDTSGSFNKACDVTSNSTDHIISSSQSSLNHGLTGTALTMEDAGSTVLADTSNASSSGAFDVNWDASN